MPEAGSVMVTGVAELDELDARIPFGSRPNQSMPASWAAGVLTLLAERHAPLFGALMTEVITGYRAETRRRRNETP